MEQLPQLLIREDALRASPLPSRSQTVLRMAEYHLLWSSRDCLQGREKELPPKLSGVMQVLENRVAIADGRLLEALTKS